MLDETLNFQSTSIFMSMRIKALLNIGGEELLSPLILVLKSLTKIP